MTDYLDLVERGDGAEAKFRRAVLDERINREEEESPTEDRRVGRRRQPPE